MAESEDATKYNFKAICCEKIPDSFLDKLVAKTHFSKFGRINRFILRPRRLCCTVEYETEEEAQRAFENAGQYNGWPFIVNYAKREAKQVEPNTEWLNAEVQSELAAMSPTGQQHVHNTLPPRLMPAPMAAPPPVRQARPTESNTSERFVQSGVRQELEALLRKPALTDEAKFRVLDARDKLLRLTQVRTTDISKATRTKGTCPDMCPEKERLMREFQRQVSYFEASNINVGSISHKKAIKEYSRSSADQEIPLSHELRPERVLRMTMLYLMHEIVDLCNQPDISLADWYHFVWDRTRSIRKDITQQELCSLQTVQLVEQCARFHIHCAARLVAEDYAVFDKKINAENLTKCLQTLKYMYHDLRLKHVHCPCESEFRSYIVLLNLGNANFLWELRQLPQAIQDSTDIKRAIGFYNALQNNNYTRFFAMIRSTETSYLSACILLGYFTRLRFNALSVIYKSYNWRRYGVYMPTQYFVKILGFESIQAAVNFLHCHGIQCNEERVMLGAPQPPDIEYSMERALQLVEAKRLVSVGECIAGQPLPSADIYLQHKPHNSFDDYGLLKQTAWTAHDQSGNNNENNNELKTEDVGQFEKPATVAPTPLFSSANRQPAHEPKVFGAVPHQKPAASAVRSNFNFGNFLVKKDEPTTNGSSNLEDNIFNIKPQTDTTVGIAVAGGNIFSKSFGQPQTAFSNFFTSNNQTENKDDDYIDDDDVDEGEDDDDDQNTDNDDDNINEDEMNDEDIRSMIDNDDDEIESMVQEDHNLLALEEESLERADKETQEEIEFMQRQKDVELRSQKLNEIEKHANCLLDKLLLREISQICTDELDECQALIDACLMKAQSMLNKYLALQIDDICREEWQVHACSHKSNMILQRSFHQWLSFVRRKAQKRKILQTLPVFVTTKTREQQTANIYMPNLIDNLDMIKRYRYGTPCDFPKLLWTCGGSKKMQPVPIFRLIAENLPQLSCNGRVRIRKYFKLLITLSAEQEELLGFKSLCESWLKQLLGPAMASTMMSGNDEGYYICDLQNDLALCVRKVSGISNITNEMEQPAWQGECDHADAIMCFMSSAYIEEAGVRLHNLFGHGRNHKKLPVAIMLHNTGHLVHNAKTIVNNIYLQKLTSKYKFYDFSKCNGKQFEAALAFLAQHVDQESTEFLEMQNLNNWLDNCLGTEMWQNLQKSALENPAFREACTMPARIVNVYNEALKHLQDMLTHDFSSCAEFPKELQQFVPGQVPHDLPLGLEYFPSDWKNQINGQASALKMLAALRLPEIQVPEFGDFHEIGIWCENFTRLCLKHVDDMTLERALESVKNYLLWCENEPQVNFLPIIRDLAHSHAQVVLNRLDDLPAIMIYKREALVEYLQKPWWLNSNSIDDIDMSMYMQKENQETQDEEMRLAYESTADVEAIIEKASCILNKVESAADNLELLGQSSGSSMERNENYVELQKCFRNYELTKLMGNYNMPRFEKRPADPLSETSRNVQNGEPKRKCTNSNVYSSSEIDATISKATTVIELVESKFKHL